MREIDEDVGVSGSVASLLLFDMMAETDIWCPVLRIQADR
jgi:hypothetical protein